MKERLPETGRIGRFVKILQSDVKTEDALPILKGAAQYHRLAAEEKSAWWSNAVGEMEDRLGVEKAVGIMQRCGAKCCGKGQRKTAQRLFMQAGSVETFLETISKHDVRDGDLRYSLEDGNTIIAEHNRCFCQQVAATKEPFGSLTYCHCSVEFNKQFFSAAFGKDVQVELLQSVICAAQCCRFKITF